MSRGEWRVVDIGTQDVDDLRTLFEHVFHHPMSAALWNWKYGAGRGVGVGVRSPTGKLLAHYGGTYRQMYLGGEFGRGVHIGDVMVAAEGRAALAHKGPFGMVTEGFFRQHVGLHSGSALGFGFPNDRHMRLGERLGHYTRVDFVVELHWSCNADSAALFRVVDWGASDVEAIIDQLWASMHTGLAAFAVPSRTGAWLRHRYANHPERRYIAHWVLEPQSMTPVGIVVLKVPQPGASELSNTEWELMDWVSNLAHAPLMVEAASKIVASLGGGGFKLWCSGAVAQLLAHTGPHTSPICSAAVTRPNSVPPALKWWLTGGDTDFR